MSPQRHLIASTGVAVPIFFITKNPICALSTIATGVLVDVDHLFEYYAFCRRTKTKWDWHVFFTAAYFVKQGFARVIFHSWELAIIGWLSIAIMLGMGIHCMILISSMCGYTLHMVMDQMGNGVSKMGYFMFYRISNDWRQD